MQNFNPGRQSSRHRSLPETKPVIFMPELKQTPLILNSTKQSKINLVRQAGDGYRIPSIRGNDVKAM